MLFFTVPSGTNPRSRRKFVEINWYEACKKAPSSWRRINNWLRPVVSIVGIGVIIYINNLNILPSRDALLPIALVLLGITLLWKSTRSSEILYLWLEPSEGKEPQMQCSKSRPITEDRKEAPIVLCIDMKKNRNSKILPRQQYWEKLRRRGTEVMITTTCAPFTQFIADPKKILSFLERERGYNKLRVF